MRISLYSTSEWSHRLNPMLFWYHSNNFFGVLISNVESNTNHKCSNLKIYHRILQNFSNKSYYLLHFLIHFFFELKHFMLIFLSVLLYSKFLPISDIFSICHFVNIQDFLLTQQIVFELQFWSWEYIAGHSILNCSSE